MNIFIPVIAFIIMAMLFKGALSRDTRKRNESFEKILQEEQDANFYRSQNIPKEIFITADPSFLNNKIYTKEGYGNHISDASLETLEKLKDNITQKAKHTMVRLTPKVSNKDLKKQYGIANLDTLINGEESYYNYIHSLNIFAETLLKYEQHPQATDVLNHAVHNMKSSVIKSYTLLFDLYKSTNNKEETIKLENHINQMDTLQNELDFKTKLIELTKEYT